MGNAYAKVDNFLWNEQTLLRPFCYGVIFLGNLLASIVSILFIRDQLNQTIENTDVYTVIPGDPIGRKTKTQYSNKDTRMCFRGDPGPQDLVRWALYASIMVGSLSLLMIFLDIWFRVERVTLFSGIYKVDTLLQPLLIFVCFYILTIFNDPTPGYYREPQSYQVFEEGSKMVDIKNEKGETVKMPQPDGDFKFRENVTDSSVWCINKLSPVHLNFLKFASILWCIISLVSGLSYILIFLKKTYVAVDIDPNVGKVVSTSGFARLPSTSYSVKSIKEGADEAMSKASKSLNYGSSSPVPIVAQVSKS
jgi:hypothetical protein